MYYWEFWPTETFHDRPSQYKYYVEQIMSEK